MTDRISRDQFVARLQELCLKSSIVGLPRRSRDRHVLLKSVVLTLNSQIGYSEPEIDDKLAYWLVDVSRSIDLDRVTLRRWLVDEGYLERDRGGSSYRVGAGGLGEKMFAAGVESVDVYRVIGEGMKEIQEKRRQFLKENPHELEQFGPD